MRTVTTAIRGSDSVILNPGGFIYVWGQLRYDDGFGERRFTNYCHRYNRETLRQLKGSTQHGIPAIYARFHESCNDAD